MTISTVFKADITRFHSSVPLTYQSETLEKINEIQKSILKFGLFTPIIVERNGATLSVIDGRKRLAALMGLVTAGVMPRDLVKVPYVVTVNALTYAKAPIQDPLALLSNRLKYHLLLTLIEEGQAVGQIAATLYATQDYVRKIGSIARLSRKLKQAVLTNSLSFEQGYALSTLTNHEAQERLLDLLGPFVDAPQIIEAIKSGETVVSCGDNNVIIMPSRRRPKLPVTDASVSSNEFVKKVRYAR